MNEFHLLDAKTPEEAFQKLCDSEIDNLAPLDALGLLGLLIDLSGDLLDPDGLDLAEVWAEKLFTKSLSGEENVILNYFCANIWAKRRYINVSQTNRTQSSNDSHWDWEQAEYEKEILFLRLALISDAFTNSDPIRKCQILTNLANAYNTTGRFIGAMEYWDRALKIQPDFGMALGNRGIGRIHYGEILPSSRQHQLFFSSAHEDLKAALMTQIHPSRRSIFNQYSQYAEQLSHAHENLNQQQPTASFEEVSISMESKAYKKWCLNNRLFMNPLNDLLFSNEAAVDNVTAPSIVYTLDEAPFYHGFFNQIKQEFVSARFLLYDGIVASEPHFSDQDVLLYNTLDYPVYSLSSEKIRIAFRVAYSLLDKIAFFLNSYLSLSIPERRVNIRTLWYVGQQKRKGLRPEFENRSNWPMRGLFWLTKDIFEDKEGFRDSTEPDSQQLADIRNHLEHKYLKLHSEYWESKSEDIVSSHFQDPLAVSIHVIEFREKSIRLMRLVRAALMYLAYALRIEEQMRAKNRSHDKSIMPIRFDEYPDEWKV